MKSHGPYHLNELFGLFEFHASILDLALNLKKKTKKTSFSSNPYNPKVAITLFLMMPY